MYLDGLVSHLITNISELEASNTFVDWMPHTPAEAVALYSHSGSEPDSKLPYDDIDFQVIARGEHGGVWADTVLTSVYTLLQGMRNTTMDNGTYVVFILAEQGAVTRIGDDENGRPRYSIDFRGEITATEGAPERS